MKTTKLLSTTALLLASSFFATSANAATFNFAFDVDDTTGSTSSANNIMDGDIIGNGTLSYDGPINTGVFALSELENFELSIELSPDGTFDPVGIQTFDQNNILASDLSVIGLNIVEDAGTFYATFIGSNGGFGGALDLANNSNSSIAFLTAAAVTDPNESPLARTYSTFGGTPLSGTYQITAQVPVPEPGTIALFGFGLIGIVFARKRLNK